VPWFVYNCYFDENNYYQEGEQNMLKQLISGWATEP